MYDLELLDFSPSCERYLAVGGGVVYAETCSCDVERTRLLIPFRQYASMQGVDYDESLVGQIWVL
jgi:hypothetical protein